MKIRHIGAVWWHEETRRRQWKQLYVVVTTTGRGISTWPMFRDCVRNRTPVGQSVHSTHRFSFNWLERRKVKGTFYPYSCLLVHPPSLLRSLEFKEKFFNTFVNLSSEGNRGGGRGTRGCKGGRRDLLVYVWYPFLSRTTRSLQRSSQRIVGEGRFNERS